MVADDRRRKPSKRARKLTKGEQESFLKRDDALKVVSADVRRQKLKQLERQKKNLRRVTPSEAWVDDAWERDCEFPPGGISTLMRKCRGCERFTPPNCLSSSDHCEDCKLGKLSKFQLSLLQRSASVVDMARLKKNARAGKGYFSS